MATRLRAEFPEYVDTIRRGWQSRQGSDEPDVMGLPGFSFEVKNLKRFNIKPLLQAESYNLDEVSIAVIYQPRDSNPVAMIRLEDLLSLIRSYLDFHK